MDARDVTREIWSHHGWRFHTKGPAVCPHFRVTQLLWKISSPTGRIGRLHEQCLNLLKIIMRLAP